MAIPGIVMICGRRIFNAASNSSFSARTVLDMPSWITGIEEAVYLMTSGGVIPGGICRKTACDTDTTCAIAI